MKYNDKLKRLINSAYDIVVGDDRMTAPEYIVGCILIDNRLFAKTDLRILRCDGFGRPFAREIAQELLRSGGVYTSTVKKSDVTAEWLMERVADEVDNNQDRLEACFRANMVRSMRGENPSVDSLVSAIAKKRSQHALA